MKRSELRKQIREILEEELSADKQKLDEVLSKKDYEEIKDIIRAEIAAVFFDLFKKRQIWI